MSRTEQGRKRIIEAWLVSRVADMDDFYSECPYRAYQRKEDAEVCKRRVDMAGDDPYWPEWGEINLIEVVVDD